MNGDALKNGFYDLNQDGVMDTLAFTYQGKAALFIFDDGKLPWDSEPDEGWEAYFKTAFRAGEGANPWNEIRLGWGSYTLLIDKEGCGRFDLLGDYCYRAFDLNGDGAPEAEYYHLFPGEDWCPYSNKFVVNFNGERDLSYLDFENLTYPDERTYDEGGKYRMNIHGSGFFVNSYCAHPEASWETPIAWYDFDCDGKTNMTMRVGDTTHNDNIATINLVKEYDRYAGTVSEFELAYELNGDCELKTDYTREECIAMTEYKIPSGYSCHLSGDYLREKYHNGFWLREKVFADICCCTKLDRYTMEKYYYTGQYQALCNYIRKTLDADKA